MVFSWKLERREKRTWAAALFIGFFTGIAMVCLWTKQLVTTSGFLDASFLSRMQYLDMNRNALFLYVFKQRMGEVAFLVLLSAAGAAGIGSVLFLAWCGLSAGCVLTVLSVRYGIRGLLFFGGCILPQQLLFIPGYLMLLHWCARKPDRRKMALPILVVIMGCFVEGYVNPIVLKVVLKIF